MTLGSSDLQSDSDLDSIRNSCDFFAYEQIHSRTPKWIRIVDTSVAKKTKLSLRSHLTHIFTHHQHYRECETVSLAPPCDPG